MALRYDECTSGPSVYRYVGNDPLNLIDPFGLAAERGGFGTAVGQIGSAVVGTASAFADRVMAGETWRDIANYGLTGALSDMAMVVGGAGVAGARIVGGAAKAGATVFKTGHYAERLAKQGVDVARAEKAVAERIGAMRPNMSAGAEVRGRFEMDGVLLEYRAYPLPNGSVNVGTIFPVKP